MRSILLLILLFTFSGTFAQIADPSFETLSDTLADQPRHWSGKMEEGYHVKLSNDISHTGKRSLFIQGVNASQGSYRSVSQAVNVQIHRLKIIEITCYVRTENVSGSIQL